MEQFVLSFLLKSFVISAIILVALIVNALFGKVLTARLRYTVWLILLVGLIIPLPSAIDSGIIAVRMHTRNEIPYTTHESPVIEIPANTAPVMPGINIATGPFTDSSFSPVMICVLAWLIVALAVFVYHIWRYTAFLRTIRRWGVKVENEDILSVFRAVQAEKGLGKKNINIVTCGFVSSSMLTGVFRPIIILPEKHFEADELDLIFRHELIHYKRLDLYIKLLALMAMSLYWFNPLIYWMCRTMHADGEASCDEEVLLNSDKENRHFYAEIIIGMIGERNAVRTLLSTCFFYGGRINRGKFNIKRRLDSIMDTTRKIRWPAIPVISVMAALTLLSGSVFAIQDSPTALARELKATTLPLDEVMKIALARTSGSMIEEIEFGLKQGRLIYEITVRINNRAYEVEIDAVTGEITEFEEVAAAFARISDSAQVSFERATEVATARIGGGFLEEIEIEYERGLLIYEVTIRFNGRRYEVKINAVTEEIITVAQL